MTDTRDSNVVTFVSRAERDSERERQRLIREARAHYESVFPSEPAGPAAPGGRR